MKLIFFVFLFLHACEPIFAAGVAPGSPVSAGNTNQAFLPANGDGTGFGKITLDNTDVVSGAEVFNLQREHNAAASFTGLILNSAYNVKPVWTSNVVGTSTDDLKTRADDLTVRFDHISGHTHNPALQGDGGIINFSYLAGVATIAQGGTGQTTQASAITALTGLQTAGYYLRSDGTNAALSPLAAADLTGTVAVLNGGTGQSSYTNGQLLIGNTTGNTLTKASLTAGSGITITPGAGSITITSNASGTVTSVGLALPASVFSVTGSPVTTTGTLTGSFTTQTANTHFAGPTSGGASTPTFRALVGADLPFPSSSTLGGVESFASTPHLFLNSVSTTGVHSASQPDVSDLTGTLLITQGGTGQTSAANAINALLPTQTGNSGKFLTTNGSVASWGTASGGSSIPLQYAFFSANGFFETGTNVDGERIVTENINVVDACIADVGGTGTSGTLTADILVRNSSGATTSVFTTKPAFTGASRASPNWVCATQVASTPSGFTKPVLTSSSVSVTAFQGLQMDLTDTCVGCSNLMVEIIYQKQ